MTSAGRRVDLSNGPVVMGILNITPDSFYPGSRTIDIQEAITRGLGMVDSGAGILDIGGESSRPGATALTPDQECERIIPLVEALRPRTSAVISIDTRHGMTARRALEAGADWINDISALEDDPDTGLAVRDHGACVVLMHRQGTAATMQINPQYKDVVREVRDYLLTRAGAAQALGIPQANILLDPGIGFGKTLAHNLELMKHLPELCKLGYPLVLGLSRKRFIQELTGASVENRLSGSLAGALAVALAGASVLRVHDPAETVQALKVFGAIRGFNPC